MTTPLWRFPDAQAVLVDLLEQFTGPGRTDTETPDNLLEVLPFIRVLRSGGLSDRVSDHARVEVDVFATTYAQAEETAEAVRQYLIGTPLRSGPAVIDRVQCDQGPVEKPWAPGIRRFGATYSIVSRRYRTTAP